MNDWIDHFDQLVPAQLFFQGFKNYINTRSQSVSTAIERAIDVVPFEITTVDPLDVGNSPLAELTGTGWVDVREIRLAGQDLPLPITWTTPNEWQVSIPVDAGTNEVVLEAYDFQGDLVTSDAITITSSAVTPVRDSLRVSELNYNPLDAGVGEPDVGNDEFEFVELTNVGSVAIDLAGVRFVQVEVGDNVEGISFTFDAQTLEPGEFLLVARDRDAFQARYGNQLPLASGQGDAENAGQYRGRLDNGGETITLLDASGATIQQFTYDDAWYPATDGDGSSLEFIDPSQVDLNAWNDASGWRASGLSGGSPGLPPVVVGDSNFDGVFDSSDIVLVMQAGEYEDATPNNSTFAEGDWNGDGDFTTSDFVTAFAAGTYVDVAPAPGAQSADIAAAIRDFDQVHKSDRHGLQRTKITETNATLRQTELEALAIDRIFDRDGGSFELTSAARDPLDNHDDDAFDLF